MILNNAWSFVIVFVVIVITINLTKKLYLGLFAGIIATSILFHISLKETATVILQSITAKETIIMVLTTYSITFIQKMLERNGSLIRAQQSIEILCNNRRVSTFLSPLLIGLLPSAAVVKICGDIVNESAGNYLDDEEKTFVASYYRHVFECCLPTYTSILIILSLGKIPAGTFLLLMLPMVFVLIAIGYFIYLRKIPKKTSYKGNRNIKENIQIAIQGLWPLILVIFLILAFKISVLPAILISLVLYYFITRTSAKMLPIYLKTAFEGKLIANLFLVYMFKDLLAYSNCINALPELFMQLPLPPFLIFGLLFFFGAFVGGVNMINTIGIPLAIAALPNAGPALMVYLNCCGYLAMQISPTHICLTIATEHFGTTMWGLTKKTIPAVLIFFTISSLYYLLLQAIL